MVELSSDEVSEEDVEVKDEVVRSGSEDKGLKLRKGRRWFEHWKPR